MLFSFYAVNSLFMMLLEVLHERISTACYQSWLPMYYVTWLPMFYTGVMTYLWLQFDDFELLGDLRNDAAGQSDDGRPGCHEAVEQGLVLKETLHKGVALVRE